MPSKTSEYQYSLQSDNFLKFQLAILIRHLEFEYLDFRFKISDPKNPRVKIIIHIISTKIKFNL